MGIDNNANSSYLDFYLTAEIGGWVAVGFSSSSNMVRPSVAKEWENGRALKEKTYLEGTIGPCPILACFCTCILETLTI